MKIPLKIEDKTFVFIIGAPRSGTTWLHKMIADHDEVFSLNGSNTFLQNYIFPLEVIFSKEKQNFTDKGFTRGLPSKLSDNEFVNLLSDFIRRFYETIPDEKEYYVEKATDITSEIHKIRKYLPNSRFVHIIRDGRNETISEVKLRKQYGSPFGIDDLYRGALRWKKQVEEARHNSAGFASDVFEVKYEDLFENTEHYLGEIFSHIGLNCDTKILKRISNKFSYKNTPVSMPTSSIGTSNGKTKQVYELEMNIREQALFEYIAGDLLERLGYSNRHLLKNRFIYLYIKYCNIPFYFFKKRLSCPCLFRYGSRDWQSHSFWSVGIADFTGLRR